MRNQFDVLTRSKKRELRNGGELDFVPEYHSMRTARRNRRRCRRELRDNVNPEIYSGMTGRNLSRMWRSSCRFVSLYSRERSRVEWEEMSRQTEWWYAYSSGSE